MDETSKYLHGTHPREQGRLSLLNRLLNDASLAEMALEGGERVIDFGSGLGQFSRLMARKAGPDGKVLGIERDSAQIAEAERLADADGEKGIFEVREGDVLSPPLDEDEWGTFDVAHTRFVLEHVAEPQAVVHTMVRAVRPGGRIIVSDDDHDILRFWPEPPGANTLWRAYIRTFERHGFDPYVGRRLVSLLAAAGARPVRTTYVFFSACAGMESFPAFVDNFVGVIQGFREPILSEGLFDVAYFDATLENIHRWGKRPDAALWYALPWAEGVKPE